MQKTVFLLSEESGIKLFEPRASQSTDDLVVWAIDTAHLHNYLLPRDCPRVTYYAGPETTPADVVRFLGLSSDAVVESSLRFSIIRMRNALLRDAC